MPRRNRLLLLLAALALVTVGGGAGGWVWAQSLYADGWAQWLEARRAEGYSFRNAEPATGGFPTRIVMRLEQFAVRGPQGWHWQPPTLEAQAALWAPFELDLHGPGRHRLATPGGDHLTIRAQGAGGLLRVAAQGGLESGTLNMRDLAVTGLPAGQVTIETLDGELGPRQQTADGQPAMPLVGRATGILLPEQTETPFGRRIDSVALRGTLEGSLPPAPDAAALHAWRQAGGVLDVAELQLDWPPLTANGGGRLTLDSQLRPQGQLEVTLQGLNPALDRLAEAGMLDSRSARYAKLAVAALGQRGSDGGEPTVQLPVSFQEGLLFLGPVPILRLSPVLADRNSRLGALQ